MAKNNLDKFYENLDREYGKSIIDKNFEYLKSLVKRRERPDGIIDDSIPVPSLESMAEVIILMTERPNLTYRQICEKDRRHKQVIEYLFIRARNHRDEVKGVVKQLFGKTFPGLSPKMVIAFLKMWEQFWSEQRPTPFVDKILYPEKAEEILETLHFMIDGEIGKGAAIVMFVAREEGLISSCKYNDIKEEFPSIHKQAYNKELSQLEIGGRENFKQPIRVALRSRIGYTKEEDGRIVFVNTSLSPRNLFVALWRWIMSLFH